MRRKGTSRSDHPVPISAALGNHARPPGAGHAAASADQERGLGQLTRLAALLGIGLLAAAVLLPSSEAPVLVPADTLAPVATSSLAGDEVADEAPQAGAAPGRGGAEGQAAAVTPGSSSASVAGDDLAPGPTSDPTSERPTAEEETSTHTAPRETATRRRRQRGTSKPPSAKAKPAPTRSTPAAPAKPRAPAVPPAAAPAPRPAPPPPRAPARPAKPTGGPSAEFGDF